MSNEQNFTKITLEKWSRVSFALVKKKVLGSKPIVSFTH